VAVGFNALNSVVSNGNCTAIGHNALLLNTGSQNTAVGSQALASNTSSASNVAFGYNALNLATGTLNCAVGANALESLTTSNRCTAVGSGSMALVTGTQNTAVGASTLDALTTGTGNTVVGYNAGSNYTGSESSNIILGTVGGTAAESNVMRLGQTSLTKCFIGGITGQTVTGSAVLCSTSGQLGTVVSSLRYKENVSLLTNESELLFTLKPSKFSFINDASHSVKYGLIAEEVHATFPYLCLYNEEGQPNSVAYHELSTLLLNELIKLRAEFDTLKDSLL
jgi:hypothetical protein